MKGFLTPDGPRAENARRRRLTHCSPANLANAECTCFYDWDDQSSFGGPCLVLLPSTESVCSAGYFWNEANTPYCHDLETESNGVWRWSSVAQICQALPGNGNGCTHDVTTNCCAASDLFSPQECGTSFSIVLVRPEPPSQPSSATVTAFATSPSSISAKPATPTATAHATASATASSSSHRHS